MRTIWKWTALSAAVALAACGREQQKTATLPDDLQKDLASMSSGGDLAVAPASYQRMRFVSAVEQNKPTVAAKRPTVSHERLHVAARHTAAAPQPVAAEAVAEHPVSNTNAPVTTAEAPTPEPAPTAAPMPASAPSTAPAGSSAGGETGDHGQGGGIGEVIGGIFGAVIRGGHVGVDRCDPRTDGRRGGGVIEGTVLGMPMPTGQPNFPGGIRRR